MNTNTTPAPGPWSVNGNSVQCLSHAKHHTIASVNFKSIDPRCREANARLISAAPEMLSALKDFVSMVGADWQCSTEEGTDVFDSMQYAIRKAEGKAL